MARHPDSTAATETLAEIESVFDRLAGAVTANPARFFGVVGVVLAAAAGVGLVQWSNARAEAEASTAVARVEADFRKAMGAAPGSVEIPEPANPEMGRQARLETVEGYLEVAAEHSGTVSAVRALLAAGNLQAEAGELDEAIETWRRAAAGAGRSAVLRGLILSRLGSGLESAERWAEAGEAHAEAAEIEDLPTRYFAMADAARCFAEAEDRPRAQALYDRLEEESPGLELPEHVRAQLAGLGAL